MRDDVRVVGTTSTILVSVLGGNVNYPTSALLKNLTGAGTVYLGRAGVTTTGFPLAPGESLEVSLVNETLYGVATTATSIYILRRGD